MNNQSTQLAACAALFGLCIAVSGCKCLGPAADEDYIISSHSRRDWAMSGESVSLAVDTKDYGQRQSKPLRYQWTFNGTAIAGATNRILLIESMEISRVGMYGAVIWKGAKELPSAPKALSYLATTNFPGGNGGSLSAPIGAFISQPFICGGGTFQKTFAPIDSNTGGLALFYGPNASPQTGPFVNSSRSSTLTIDTFSPMNGTADTGIMLQNNFVPMNPPVCCNDDAPGGTYPKQSQCLDIPLSRTTGLQNNTYRLTLLYKDPPGAPASGVVTFNWYYGQIPE